MITRGLLWYYMGLRRMLRDEAPAEDIVHDTFMYLLSNLGKLNIKTPLESYFFRSVKNSVIDHFRKNKNREKYTNSLIDFYNQGEYATDQKIQKQKFFPIQAYPAISE